MIKESIYQLINGEDLSIELTKESMEEIMTGRATNAQIGSFITAMRMKGESIDEITACAKVMREYGMKLQHEQEVLEIVGTGGDEAHTFNISTISSIVISAAGIPVAKHGNKSVSSLCGSADVLEALGVKIDISPERSAAILKEIGICFMYANLYHSSMRYAAPVRKELGVRTIFNILGPLASPARADYQLLGVYDKKLVLPLAKVLANLGVKAAYVVHGQDGLDEVTLCTNTTICEVKDGTLRKFVLDPRELGFNYCSPEDLVGGSPMENAEIGRAILSGEKGPKRDIVLLNSALCIQLYHPEYSLEECIERAAYVIDSGKAFGQLERLIQLTNGGIL